MKSLLVRPFLSLAFCTLSAFSQAEDKMTGAGAALSLSTDNENFNTQRVALEYLPAYSHADFFSGIKYTEHRYQQNSWSRFGKQFSLMHKKIEPATASGIQIEAGIFSQGQHDLITADGNYRTQLTEGTGLEAFINRDWVETPVALDKGVNFTFGGIAIDRILNPHFTIVGVAGLQNFSDDNFRNHGRIKLIYQPDTDLGLTLQARYRAYTSSSSNVGNAYFNPGQYDESMLAMGWRQRVSGWMASLTAGAGQQKVAADAPTPTRLLELSLQSPVNSKKYSFRARALMSQSASFNGPDYQYRFVQGEWIMAL